MSAALPKVDTLSICEICKKEKRKKLDDSWRLDVVEIARVPDMLPSLFPSWSG